MALCEEFQYTSIQPMQNFILCNYKYSVIIFKNTWSGMMWIYNIIADMFRKVPAELTYWHDGVQNVVQVDDFVELAPNMIQYEDTDTKKRVKVKAEYPIKYILKEK